MARSSRPELEKDNPAAPQMYSRRKRRTHHALSGHADEAGSVGETLWILTEAAERFVNGVPRSKRMEAERQALLDAITQAQLVLSVERESPVRPLHPARR